jgi:hypothetical protein
MYIHTYIHTYISIYTCLQAVVDRKLLVERIPELLAI